MQKFDDNDIFHNVIKSYPKSHFFIYDNRIYYNNQQSTSSTPAPLGNIDFAEINQADHPVNAYLFKTKDSSNTSFKSVSTYSTTDYGTDLIVHHPFTSSLSSSYYAGSSPSGYEYAFAGAQRYYTNLSKHFTYDFTNDEMRWFNIPSIFYGSSIRKGSVKLRFYVSGTLTAEAQDIRRNGELIETTGSVTGSVVGLVAYGHGLMMLTASYRLGNSDHSEPYKENGDADYPKWIYFGEKKHDIPSSSYELSFDGTTYIPTLTALVHANAGELNYSNNPTFIQHGQDKQRQQTGSTIYVEHEKIAIKNISSSSFANVTGSFEKTTYISKIALYDENKNLIGIAKVAKPIKKKEHQNYIIKLKLDL